jgi:hypothetical protein
VCTVVPLDQLPGDHGWNHSDCRDDRSHSKPAGNECSPNCLDRDTFEGGTPHTPVGVDANATGHQPSIAAKKEAVDVLARRLCQEARLLHRRQAAECFHPRERRA